eukprot:6181365-Pleurochrysis_carterae.AAC.2
MASATLPAAMEKQIAVIEFDNCMLLALVTQLIGPLHSTVHSVSWCAADASLAIAAGNSVHIYRLEATCRPWQWVPDGQFNHEQTVSTMAWAQLQDGSPAIWAAGRVLSLWVKKRNAVGYGDSAQAASRWVSSWRRGLSQEVQLMAVSFDGTMLATAARDDRFVKVWRLQLLGAAAATVDEVDALVRVSFSYLRHPRAVLELEWRTPPRTAQHAPASYHERTAKHTQQARTLSSMLLLF